jgi:predicted DNA-binding transcriptional regulator AlpA
VDQQENKVNALLSDHDVARIMQISVVTLWRWRSNGTGPKYRKLGKAIRYTREDLAAWIESQPGGGE